VWVSAHTCATTRYLPAIEKAWDFMAGTALHPSGQYGYCQPVGASPEHNISPNATSDFCVGQFLLAATEMAKLAKAPPPTVTTSV
jgi:hypothetical protein